MIITEIQYFFSKIIRFQAIFKDTVEFTCALEFKISSQPNLFLTILYAVEPQSTHPTAYVKRKLLLKYQLHLAHLQPI